ncbi:MAG: hypothetical protein Q4P23_14205 [Micrococcaceae bacterium]|nr:hypothetical protein [Micrococcaceae bacterium]
MGTGFTAPTVPALEATVLVLDDGSPMVGAIADRLSKEGVPTEVVELGDPGRHTIDDQFLAGGNASGARGRFSGVVLPSDAPQELSATEKSTLNAYEAAFGVRQVSMYDWANPTLGLNYAASPGYVGAVDGLDATVSEAGLQGPFGYLRGTVALDDIDPGIDESYGYLATPLVEDPQGGTFTPLLTATIPGTGTQGSLIGQYDQGGRERLVITFASNRHQQHFKVLSHGIVTWLTRGISTSLNRNYLSVHSDDLFMSDAKWSIPGNCTIGDGCDPQEYPQGAPGATVRMDDTDITRQVTWQDAHGLKIDQAFNGFGSQDYAQEHAGSDPLLDAAKANATGIRWISHTLKHEFMGCTQTSNTPPWSCLTDAAGTTQWYAKSRVDAEIADNLDFAAKQGLPLDGAELVSGEHSGLKTLPQQPVDNPNFLSSLTDQGINWVASDASREFDPRPAGSTMTVPRYPMNLYYNVSTKEELASEFNWIYTTRADGGSGLCEDYPETSSCITPLALTSGFEDYIKPLESRVTFGHISDNDARPHFAHQSNLADDGLLYPVLGDAIERYNETYTAQTELVNPSMSEAGQVLVDQHIWKSKASSVASVLQGNRLTVKNTASASVKIPVTVPEGTTSNGTAFGQAYAGERSAWVDLPAGASMVLVLPADTGFKSPGSWPAAPAPAMVAPMPKDAPDTTVIEAPEVHSDIVEEALESVE